MTFTVRDALQTERLRRAHVRAGAEGLARPVTSVNVMEVPDILPWVKPHELLLTTLYPLRDVPGSLSTFVEELAGRGLAGIVVKTGRYYDTLPDEMCCAAERVSLPLIELTQTNISFDEIITDLLGRILNAQTHRLQQSEEIHRRFTAVVLDGGGLQHIADTLALLVHNPVMIVATDRRVLAVAAPDAADIERIGECISTELNQQYLDFDPSLGTPYSDSTVVALHQTPRVAEQQVDCFACPIRVGAHTYGSVITLALGPLFHDSDALAMEHAATVSALALMKEQAILAVERKFQSDFLDDLLAGRIASLDVVLSRSQTLGWNLARPCVVCVAEERVAQNEVGGVWRAMPQIDDIDSNLLDSARVAARRSDPEAIVMEKSGQLTFILGVPDARGQGSGARGQQRTFARDVAIGQHLLRDLHALQEGRQFLLGIGRRSIDALHLHHSYNQARQAIAIGSQIDNTNAVVHFDELGFQRILFQFEDRGELHAFANELLGGLEAHDQRHQMNLLKTLEVVLDSNLNMVMAANRLHLHYNSLRYRLQKVVDLVGPFMNDAQLRMNLELALQIRKLRRD